LVGNVETWEVGPTMQRGQKRKHAPKVPFRKKVARQQRMKKKKTDKSQKAVRIGQQVPEKQDEKTGYLDPNVFGPEDFARSFNGRSKIQKCFQQVIDLDLQMHPKARAFDETGKCRMKGVVANKPEIIAASPQCLETKQLDLM